MARLPRRAGRALEYQRAVVVPDASAAHAGLLLRLARQLRRLAARRYWPHDGLDVVRSAVQRDRQEHRLGGRRRTRASARTSSSSVRRGPSPRRSAAALGLRDADLLAGGADIEPHCQLSQCAQERVSRPASPAPVELGDQRQPAQRLAAIPAGQLETGDAWRRVRRWKGRTRARKTSRLGRSRSERAVWMYIKLP